MVIARSIAGSTVALVTALSLGACGSSGSDVGTGPSSTATVRFANGQAGGAQPYVLSANGTAVGAAVSYQNSGACQTIPAGNTTFAFAQQGSSTPLLTLNQTTLTGGRRYTVFATGVLSVARGLVLADSFGTAASGHAKLRVLNATNQATSFDVYVGDPGSALGTAASSNVGFQSAPIIDVPAGDVLVRLTAAGFTTVIGSKQFTLSSGDEQTLVITAPPDVGDPYPSFLVAPCS
jgi:hypothetical protein